MFQTGSRVVFALMVTAAGTLYAQTFAQAKDPGSLAGLVLSEIPALDAAPDLAVWRSLHPNERLKNAAYDNEYETQGLWCAASVAEFALPGGVKATRQAFFYIPSGKPGDLLPGHRGCKPFAAVPVGGAVVRSGQPQGLGGTRQNGFRRPRRIARIGRRASPVQENRRGLGVRLLEPLLGVGTPKSAYCAGRRSRRAHPHTRCAHTPPGHRSRFFGPARIILRLVRRGSQGATFC